MPMPRILLQAAEAEPRLFGWYLGFAIGFAIIVVVVVIVAAILTLAERIGKQAQEAIEALEQGRMNTLPMWDLAHTNEHAQGVLLSLQQARGVLQEEVARR